MTRWAELAGEAADDRAAGYEARFAQLAASGVGVHGEADRCTQLVPPGARVLDAGCGTGRVAIELARRGYQVVGVDVDGAMLARAREAAPELTWVEHDLATLDPQHVEAVGGGFDLVVAAGNVIPLVRPGTEQAVLARLAHLLAPGGLLAAGFGLDAAHLPIAAAPFGLTEYDAWCTAVGLTLVERSATWDDEPYTGGGYAVSVHHRSR